MKSMGADMRRYWETKSRKSVTKDFGGAMQVEVVIPANTCHPGATVQFHSLANPPVWKCEKCGGVIREEKLVNAAEITEL
jgi:hypothetical protein